MYFAAIYRRCMVALALITLALPSYAESLYAPNYASTLGAAPTNYKASWRVTVSGQTYGSQHANATDARNSLGCAQFPTAGVCTAPIWFPSPQTCVGNCPAGKTLACGVNFGVGTCTPVDPPCPYGGTPGNGTPDRPLNMCVDVPWGQGPNPINCQSGQVKSLCTPGDGSSGSALTRFEGCVYTPTNVSNQFAVDGVQSRCGTWTNTGYEVSATQDSDKGSSTIPTPSQITSVATVPTPAPPGFDLPPDGINLPENPTVDPLPPSTPPTADPTVVQLDTSMLAKENTLVSGFNKTIQAVQNASTSASQAASKLYDQGVDQLNALSNIYTKTDQIAKSLTPTGQEDTTLGAASTALDQAGADHLALINGTSTSGDHGFTWEWFPTIPSSGSCTNPTINMLGDNMTVDFCTAAGYTRQALAWLVYFFGGLTILNIVTGRKAE